MVVTPPIAPNTMPVATLGFGIQRSKRLAVQCRSTNSAAISPMARRMCAADSDAAISQAMNMPTNMLGSMILRFQALHSRRYTQSVRKSCAIAVGRMMAAACSGGTNSDISGSAITPRPRKPPFEMPSRQTPMTATAMNMGSASSSTGVRRLDVMAGLDPAIHALRQAQPAKQGVRCPAQGRA